MTNRNALLLLVLLNGSMLISTHAQDTKKSDTLITTIPQLQAAIEKVLQRTKTPAVGIAMVDANGPV